MHALGNWGGGMLSLSLAALGDFLRYEHHEHTLCSGTLPLHPLRHGDAQQTVWEKETLSSPGIHG